MLVAETTVVIIQSSVMIVLVVLVLVSAIIAQSKRKVLSWLSKYYGEEVASPNLSNSHVVLTRDGAPGYTAQN